MFQLELQTGHNRFSVPLLFAWQQSLISYTCNDIVTVISGEMCYPWEGDPGI